MVNDQFSAMTIYVDQEGKLICAPFGTNKDVKMVYEGVDLLNTDSWQHVSCMYSDQKYVKGQYIDVNINKKADITSTLLHPQSFA